MNETLKANGVPCAWVAPVYRQAKIAFRYFVNMFKDMNIFERSPNKSNLEIFLLNNNILQFRSADKAEYLEGEGYKAVVIEEAWHVLQKEDTWFASIRPTLADHEGRACFISRGDFTDTLLYKLYELGQRQRDDIISYHYTTADNPLIKLDELKSLKELPKHIYKQHILAEFLNANERAIPNIIECATGHYEDEYKTAYAPYIMGVDLGKDVDYTVITVGRQGEVIYFERFKDISWGIQYRKIREIAERYKAKIVVDSTGVGDPCYDILIEMGLEVEPFGFTERSRKQLLELLILRMDQKRLKYPAVDVLIEELKSIRWNIKPSGKVKLEVPEGRHDDCVMSLALCNWGMSYAIDMPVTKNDFQTFGGISNQDSYISNANERYEGIL